MKIYTRSGDDGTTGLFGGGRVAKCNLRVEAYGSVDELNSVLGVVRSVGVSSDLDDILGRLQNQLFDLGAELATPDPAAKGTTFLVEADVDQVEGWIDRQTTLLPELTTFILPAGSQAAATLHLARSVCRRAERHVVDLARHESIRDTLLKYLNRVSDLLFVLARVANIESGTADTAWTKKPGNSAAPSE